MRLNQLKYLCELKKTGSMTKAAKKMFISQPSLSEAIKELEQEIGYELVARNKRGVTFTPIGDSVVERAYAILDLVNEIKNIGQADAGMVKGRLFVGGVPTACDALLLDIIINLQEKYPELKIMLTESDSFGLVQKVGDQELDFALILMSNDDQEVLKEEMERKSLEFIPYFEDEMCFWAGPRNPLTQRKEVKMQDVLKYPYIYYKGNYNRNTQKMFNEFLPNERVEVIRVEDRESLKKYIMKSQAVSFMPRHASVDNVYQKEGMLIPLNTIDFHWLAQWGIVKRIGKPASKEENIFFTMLKEKIKELD